MAGGLRREGNFWKRFLWDEGGLGLERIFPKQPLPGMVNPDTGKSVFAQVDGVLTDAGSRDYKQSLADYNKFYEHLRESTDWDWTETDTPTHKKIGPTPRYTQHYDKVFGETVPAMYAQMPSVDTGALYNLPQNPFDIQSILNMGRRRR